jgi:hypothetical protein
MKVFFLFAAVESKNFIHKCRIFVCIFCYLVGYSRIPVCPKTILSKSVKIHNIHTWLEGHSVMASIILGLLTGLGGRCGKSC